MLDNSAIRWRSSHISQYLFFWKNNVFAQLKASVTNKREREMYSNNDYYYLMLTCQIRFGLWSITTRKLNTNRAQNGPHTLTVSSIDVVNNRSPLGEKNDELTDLPCWIVWRGLLDDPGFSFLHIRANKTVNRFVIWICNLLPGDAISREFWAKLLPQNFFSTPAIYSIVVATNIVQFWGKR